MNPDDQSASWIITIVAPIVTLLTGVIVARVTAKGNQRVTEIEREIPPYDALAARTSKLEALVRDLEQEHRDERAAFSERTKCLEDAVDELHKALEEDREWIKDTIVVAERRGATGHIPPIPGWIDLDSDSMRRRRRRLGVTSPADTANNPPPAQEES